MSNTQKEQEKIPVGQVVFDEIFLFFMLSLTISFLLYNIWGLMELLGTPMLVVP